MHVRMCKYRTRRHVVQAQPTQAPAATYGCGGVTRLRWRTALGRHAQHALTNYGNARRRRNVGGPALATDQTQSLPSRRHPTR
jgi:hypothetical protein